MLKTVEVVPSRWEKIFWDDDYEGECIEGVSCKIKGLGKAIRQVEDNGDRVIGLRVTEDDEVLFLIASTKEEE